MVSVIEILCFYFIGRKYLFINGLDDMITYVVLGDVFFFVSYFLMVEANNFRKKTTLIAIAYGLLVAAPFVYKTDIPNFNVDDATEIIHRTEGGRIVKDRVFGPTMVDYDGQEVYIITIKKDKKVKRFAFDPKTEKYFSFAD